MRPEVTVIRIAPVSYLNMVGISTATQMLSFIGMDTISHLRSHSAAMRFMSCGDGHTES
jgi:hypothetical protein